MLNVSVKMKNKRLEMADRPMGCRTTISRCRNPSLWDCAFFSMPHFPTLKNGHTGPMRNNIRPIMPKTCPGHPIGPSHEEGFGGSGPDKRTRRPSREIPDGLNGTGRDGNREIIPTPASQARKNGKSGIFPTILTLRGKKNKIIHAFVVKFCLKPVNDNPRKRGKEHALGKVETKTEKTAPENIPDRFGRPLFSRLRLFNIHADFCQQSPRDDAPADCQIG